MSTTNPAMFVQAYLFFDGRCEEALEFYRTAIGAQIEIAARFKDSPVPTMCPSDSAEKIMHATFRIGETTVMASDGRCQSPPKFEGFSLSIAVPDEAEAKSLFTALADGGTVVMPLTPTFYSPCFGMVTDRFGVSWMIIVPAEISPSK